MCVYFEIMRKKPAGIIPALPDGVRKILDVFARAGVEAWLVGGCVRDSLLGCAPQDFDIAAAAPPERTQALFEKTAPTGIRYGTVTVFCGGARAEVTAFRAETGILDARHPAEVRFGTSLREDLARRDFTINAMAWHPARGLYDPFGGVQDLRKGLIRAVGKPRRRFEEDALRILRAYRFAAQLGFAIEPETHRAVVEMMPLTAALSGERIRQEWEKMLCGPCPSGVFLPELKGVWRALGFPVTAVRPPEGLERISPRPAARWAAFVFLSRMDAEPLFARLRFSNRLAAEIRRLLSVLSGTRLSDAVSVKQALAGMPPALLEEALLLRGALLNEDTAAPRALLKDILARKEPYRPEHLALRGGDVAALGFTGAACGGARRAALAHVLAHPEDNTPEKLRDFLLRQTGFDPQ